MFPYGNMTNLLRLGPEDFYVLPFHAGDAPPFRLWAKRKPKLATWHNRALVGWR